MIMKQGVVQQVGTPVEIYDKPVNAFVASFIGNPAMNLIEGEILGNTFRANNVKIAGLNAPDGPVKLGFRAEDASVVKKGGAINAPIYTMELLGDATTVSVRIGGTLISVKADKSYRAAMQEAVSISVTPEKCHVFDAADGARIEN